MPDTPLNPDALGRMFATAMMEVLDAEKLQPGDRLVHVNDMQEVLNRLEKNILAAALPEVTSVEELKALPIGSVILDGGGDAGIIEPGSILFAETNPLSPEYVAKHYFPARVLYRPSEQP